MLILFPAMTVGACALLYLSHRHQGWLARPLAPAWRLAGLALLALALACGLRRFSAASAIFAWLVLAMLAFSLMPFLALLRKGGRHE